MNLLLWRHAEAEDGIPDLARRLTIKGQQQARKVGGWIDRHFPQEGRILVSPALRTRQTADALGRDYQIEKTIAPGADVSNILSVAGLNSDGQPEPENENKSLLLVGHQPWVGATARFLLTDQDMDWSVRKAALWWLVCRQRFGEGEWTLRCLMDPDLI